MKKRPLSTLKKVGVFKIILFAVNMMLFTFLNSQTLITELDGKTTSADNSSILDVASDSKGVLLPRMSSVEKNNIVSPKEGLVIYNTDINRLEIFTNNRWNELVLKR